MIPEILVLVALQSQPKSTAAPIEPQAKTEMDQRRLSQYPHLGGGLYNIDAVPPEDIPQPPIPPAARDPLYRQKKIIENLSKRLEQAHALLDQLDHNGRDRGKAFKKVGSLMREIQHDFGVGQRPAKSAIALPDGDVQQLVNLVEELKGASVGLDPKIMDISVAERLWTLAGTGVALSEQLSKAAQVKTRP